MEAFKKVDVLRKLDEIFQRANPGKKSEEISLLKKQCAEFVVEERLRCTTSDGDIVVRMCEFSRLQFPKSQIERSGLNVPVE